MKNIIGGRGGEEAEIISMDEDEAYRRNGNFWDMVGSEALGVTALPQYGAFVTEEKLHLLGDIADKKILEIGCGNGHSLKYVSEMGASELWGLDISPMQIERTREYILSQGIEAKLICAPMEKACGIPEDYFDIVYAVYSIGWTTDLNAVLGKIASYLKQDGIFIFSWSHPIHKCVTLEDDKLIFCNSYFDESWYSASVSDQKIMLSNRKLSTYINALAEAGFVVEKLIEESDQAMIEEAGYNEFSQKARLLPVTFVIRARKL